MVVVGRVGGPGPLAGGRRPGVAGFAMPSAPAGAAAATTRTEATSAVMLGGMLALQEEDSAPARDRRARRHGQVILTELARLQRALLGGLVDAGLLDRLAALTEMVPEAADPALRALIRSVTLRAQIELARRA